MRRRTCVTLALVAVAVGAGAAWAGTLTPAGAANRRAAESSAAALIALLRLPPGAVRSPADPSRGSLLGRPATRPVTPNLVDRHQFFRIPGGPRVALSWIEDHRPPGSHLVGQGQLSGPGTAQLEYDQFAWPSTRALASRELLVAVTGASQSATALRVDAEVVWNTPRPASERIPPGIDAVTVAVTRFGRSASALVKVSDPAEVSRIVTLLNRLPAAQPGAVACPMDDGAEVVLSFAGEGAGNGTGTGASPRLLARAVADASGCGLVTLRIFGRRQPDLAGGVGLAARLSSRLGLSLG